MLESDHSIARSSRAMTTAGISAARKLVLSSFGEFDLDAQLDLGEHGIKPGVT
jgi:hypothetical protein